VVIRSSKSQREWNLVGKSQPGGLDLALCINLDQSWAREIKPVNQFWSRFCCWCCTGWV
jgi:hypothetical protein